MVNYSVLDRKEAIPKIIEGKQIICVSGGFFGDEAKGKTVADLSEFVDGIARVNSGENAGHTVHHNGQKFVFHLVPSGIMTGKPTFIGSNCVMDPISLLNNEIAQLQRANIDYSNLTVGNSVVVAPWHKIVDLMGNINASTGKGMSQIHQDIAGKRAARLEDFINNNFKTFRISFDFWMDVLNSQGHSIESIKKILNPNPKVPEYIKEFLEQENNNDRFNYAKSIISSAITDKTFPLINNPRAEMTKILKNGGIILLEGPQSFYLSNLEGTHSRSATSAQTHPAGIFAASGLSPTYKALTINVLKVPSSRVGSGANPCGYVEQDWFAKKKLKKENLDALCLDFNHVYNEFLNSIGTNGIIQNTNSTYRVGFSNIYLEDDNVPLKINEAMAIVSCIKYGEFGATTGKPRVCGSLDLLHLQHLVKYQNKKINFSCIDRLDGLDRIPVVIGYKYNFEKSMVSNGKNYTFGEEIMIGDELPNEYILEHCTPIYEILPGWKTSKGFTNGNLIDPNLANFINYVENKTGCEIISFGNGPETDEIVYIQKQQ